MSPPAGLAAMNSAPTVREINEASTAKNAGELHHARIEVRNSVDQMLGPSVSHSDRAQAMNQIFNLDPHAEAKIHAGLPNLKLVNNQDSMELGGYGPQVDSSKAPLRGPHLKQYEERHEWVDPPEQSEDE